MILPTCPARAEQRAPGSHTAARPHVHAATPRITHSGARPTCDEAAALRFALQRPELPARGGVAANGHNRHGLGRTIRHVHLGLRLGLGLGPGQLGGGVRLGLRFVGVRGAGGPG